MPAPVAPGPAPPGDLGPVVGESAAATGPPEGPNAGLGDPEEAGAWWSPRRNVASAGDRHAGLAPEEAAEEAAEVEGALKAIWEAVVRTRSSIAAARKGCWGPDWPKLLGNDPFRAMEQVFSKACLDYSG